MNPKSDEASTAAMIEGLRSSMETGFSRTEKSFDRLENRIETMVTKDTFKAEVSRLDQKDTHLEEQMKDGFTEVKSDMASGFAALRDRDKERDHKFNVRTGWLLTGAGVVSGIVFGVISIFF